MNKPLSGYVAGKDSIQRRIRQPFFWLVTLGIVVGNLANYLIASKYSFPWYERVALSAGVVALVTVLVTALLSWYLTSRTQN